MRYNTADGSDTGYPAFHPLVSRWDGPEPFGFCPPP